MIREGARDAALKALARQIDIFNMVQSAGRSYNISRYARYLRERVVQYSKTRTDYVRSKSKMAVVCVIYRSKKVCFGNVTVF